MKGESFPSLGILWYLNLCTVLVYSGPKYNLKGSYVGFLLADICALPVEFLNSRGKCSDRSDCRIKAKIGKVICSCLFVCFELEYIQAQDVPYTQDFTVFVLTKMVHLPINWKAYLHVKCLYINLG